jgi:hypothetical protein
MKRTLVALYDDFAVAQDVGEDLVEAGYKKEDISVIANDTSGEYAKRYNIEPTEDVSAGEGAGFGLVVGALVGLGAMIIPGIGPVIAAGPLASALIGAGVGAVAGAVTGGIVGGLVNMGVPEEDAHYYAEGVRRGGTLVIATVEDSWLETARSIMQRHNPVDLNERSGQWRQGGWGGFDSQAVAYSADDLRNERSRYTTSDSMSESSYSKAGAQSTTGYGAADRYTDYETDYRNHYQTYYSGTGYDYDYYVPAYRYGSTLASDAAYRDWDWNRLEPEARSRWERDYMDSPWEDFKEAVHHAWMRVKDAVS